MMTEAIISIKPSYVDSILSGKKTIEVRRKPLNLPVGARLWIYSTLPNGAIVATVTIKTISRHRPIDLWENYSKQISISKSAFDEYAIGVEQLTAVQIEGVNVLENPITLNQVRDKVGTFQPPQTFMYLKDGSILYEFLYSMANLSCENLQVA